MRDHSVVGLSPCTVLDPILVPCLVVLPPEESSPHPPMVGAVQFPISHQPSLEHVKGQNRESGKGGKRPSQGITIPRAK